jgi:hypothetical protein
LSARNQVIIWILLPGLLHDPLLQDSQGNTQLLALAWTSDVHSRKTSLVDEGIDHIFANPKGLRSLLDSE